MRILWHSCAPWAGTGYGTQTKLWTNYLKHEGYEVAISSYYGAPGFAADWGGIPVFPPPQEGSVHRMVKAHADRFKPDVIIVLADVWLMDPRVFKGYNTYCWLPVDTSGNMSAGDEMFIRNGDVKPIAMSEHGRITLSEAGFGNRYIPHGIDTVTFQPPSDRDNLRAAFGINKDEFAIGINANNIDPVRKALPEQLMAFARFHLKHPNSSLFVHSMVRVERSLDLEVLVADLGIKESVRFCDQYRLQAGQFTDEEMSHWYGAMDVVSNATYGEGFGLPAIEAQACGTPVILSKGTTGPQLVGPGWLADTEPYWNLVHRAWWHRPNIASITKCYEKAYKEANSPFKRQVCVQFAQSFDVDTVGPMWSKLLEEK